MILVQDLEVVNCCVGSANVRKIYFGNLLVWPIYHDYIADERGLILSGYDPANSYGPRTLSYIRANNYGGGPIDGAGILGGDLGKW